MTDIDFLVGAYGFNNDIDTQIGGFLCSFRDKCNLDGVNVVFAERAHRPMPDHFKDAVSSMGFQVRTCPLPPASTCREDTSRFCDWMVTELSFAPWFIVSHFDVTFIGDYIGYIRQRMAMDDMVGDHHNGIVAVKRDAYDQCQVGFCGIDGYIIYHNVHNELQLAAKGAPYNGSDAGACLSLDVGELLALRMCTLGLKHTWMTSDSDVGKSNLFMHVRRGSGHGMS